ncbi:hypothetical protein RhiirA1_541880 [Rhizophagus irregularis]|uniref:Uncharacterized protein n=1 Tax=Rhizophagus irregularis TaxID=588596 RepID=A0A2N0R0R9_9GLOM|nr:hypothetical protein RhiirA1_541880 [Rhizophagus irregularis]
MPKIKAKKTCENIPKEITEYPKTDVILYTDGRRSYHYRVKKEGLYLQPPILAYSQGKNKYKIPDSYCVETTWGRDNNKQTVECSINYIREKPFFRVMYGSNFSEDVCSNTSPTAAANAIIRKLFPNNEKTLMSGIHLFGIHLETLKQARESKRESNNELDFVENSNIFDYGITDEIKNITNGGHRSAKDILTYIIPALIFKGVLDISNPIIHLRISGDGRNVGRKIKQVMITMGILNDEQNIHKLDHHYTTILFPGIESYELLEVMMSPFIQELNDLKNYANSNYFCLWCQISKHDQVNNQTNWKISKKMEKINEYPGHSKKPLFNMISLDHWIPDELHIMLRIFDHLWSLELKDVDQFDNVCRNEIVKEMNRIGVRFQFWKENGSNTWNYTSLMGNDKLKVLKDFNLVNVLIDSQYANRGILWTSSFDMDLEKLQVGKKHFELRYKSCWKEIPWTSTTSSKLLLDVDFDMDLILVQTLKPYAKPDERKGLLLKQRDELIDGHDTQNTGPSNNQLNRSMIVPSEKQMEDFDKNSARELNQ